MTPTVAFLNVGRPQHLDDDAWVTAIFKNPVSGPVSLGLEGLAGDEQADRRVHGGPDKAVCVYSLEHLKAWQSEPGTARWSAGAAGENFSVTGQVEATVAIGDTFEVGTAVVQVSQPRSPCWKLARRWQLPDLTKRVVRSGRTGWYLRVLRPGAVEAGQELRITDRPCPEWTIQEVNRLMYLPREAFTREDSALVARLARNPALSEAWRASLLEDSL